MPDELCLSLWVRGYDESTMLRHFEELLRVFPFSRLRAGISLLRIYALEFLEPPLLERAYGEGAEIDALIEVCREFQNADCAYSVDGWWELLRYKAGWLLAPSRVSLHCFGPLFEDDPRDHLRIEFGPETDFLPQAGVPDSARKAQSNLMSVVRLVREIEASLPIERKSVWSESGENFAERLEIALLEDAG